MKKYFTPFSNITKFEQKIILFFWIGLFLSYWTFFIPEKSLAPTLPEVINGWIKLWNSGLFYDIIQTLKLTITAAIISIIVSAIFAYSSPIPFFKPLSLILTKLRYNPIVGFTLFLMIASGGGRNLQILLLVIFTSFYFINSLVFIIDDIPEEALIRRQTQKMSAYKILWKEAILDRADYLIEVIRQNLSIMLMMIVSVEAMDKSQGGLGSLLIDINKGLNFSKIFAIQLTILIIGITLDYILKSLFNSFPAQKKSR